MAFARSSDTARKTLRTASGLALVVALSGVETAAHAQAATQLPPVTVDAPIAPRARKVVQRDAPKAVAATPRRRAERPRRIAAPVVPSAATPTAVPQSSIETLAQSRERQAAEVFSAPRSSSYISPEEIERFSYSSPADILKGQPGVQVGDSRNGGALDVNIRGIQGQDRVPVLVDGSEQSINTYRGYGGTQQRSYIDPDLIGSAVVSRGPSLAPGAAGAVGGTVALTTIGVTDIVKPGQNFGARLKGDFANNSIAPPAEGNAIPRLGAKYANETGQAGSAAFGYTSETFDLVTAYARREQGNFYAGTEGWNKYRRFTVSSRGRVSEDDTVASTFERGEEVLNTSRQTESALVKATIRPADDQSLELGFRHFDGRSGDIMPSVVFRGTRADANTIPQFPLGSVKMDVYTARYAYKPRDNDVVDLKINAWMTDTDSELLNGSSYYSPTSQHWMQQGRWGPYSVYAWRRFHNRRIGLDANNRSVLLTDVGKFTLDVGASVKDELIEPAKGVVITADDRLNNRLAAHGNRQEASLTTQLEYRPIEPLALWAGGRYLSYRTSDKNQFSNLGRFSRPFPDGPRLDPRVENAQSGFAPAFGLSYEIVPNTLVYASYTEGLRAPGLFESLLGTDGLLAGDRLKMERAGSWEVGASTTQTGVLKGDDRLQLKVSHFHTTIRNYITRFYNPEIFVDDYKGYFMNWYNADRYTVSGIEMQGRYDAGIVFADASGTLYYGAKTCDAETAQKLRDADDPSYGIDTLSTPNCVRGGFSGAYTNTQNPPKYAINLTLGTRLFDERLTLGARMNHTSAELHRLDTAWNAQATTVQLRYLPVYTFDLFASYKFNDTVTLHAAVQNLTDAYYLDPLAQTYMPAPGRTFRTSLSLKF